MSHFIEAVIIIAIGALFILYVDFPNSNAPIQRQWLDEETVCYTQNGKIINCETLAGWE